MLVDEREALRGKDGRDLSLCWAIVASMFVGKSDEHEFVGGGKRKRQAEQTVQDHPCKKPMTDAKLRTWIGTSSKLERTGRLTRIVAEGREEAH